jgi:hypothetical protein
VRSELLETPASDRLEVRPQQFAASLHAQTGSEELPEMRLSPSAPVAAWARLYRKIAQFRPELFFLEPISINVLKGLGFQPCRKRQHKRWALALAGARSLTALVACSRRGPFGLSHRHRNS